MLVNISFQLDTDIPEDVAKLRRIVGLETAPGPGETFPEPAPKVVPKAKPKPKVVEPEAPVLTPAPSSEVFKKVADETQPTLVPEPERREALPFSINRREQAVHKATELVTTGQSQRVRDALGSLGAKRVSDLEDAQLEGFLAAVAR